MEYTLCGYFKEHCCNWAESTGNEARRHQHKAQRMANKRNSTLIKYKCRFIQRYWCQWYSMEMFHSNLCQTAYSHLCVRWMITSTSYKNHTFKKLYSITFILRIFGHIFHKHRQHNWFYNIFTLTWTGPVFIILLGVSSGYAQLINLPCEWPSTALAYSEVETENGPRLTLFK